MHLHFCAWKCNIIMWESIIAKWQWYQKSPSNQLKQIKVLHPTLSFRECLCMMNDSAVDSISIRFQFRRPNMLWPSRSSFVSLWFVIRRIVYCILRTKTKTKGKNNKNQMLIYVMDVNRSKFNYTHLTSNHFSNIT